LDAGRGAGLRLAARTRVGEPEPQRRQPQHGPLLRRHRDAGRRDLERGQGHDPASRAVRRPRHRRPGGAGRDGAARTRMADRLQAARDLVRADLPQACRQALSRRPHPRRTTLLRPCDVQAVAAAGAWLQGDPQALSRLRTVARLPVRICLRKAADRRHQRLAAATRVGRRCRCRAGRPRCADDTGRTGVAGGVPGRPHLL
ncbi:MAG: Protein YzbB, partial [uncultured Sphingomonas sp.]